jgi:hemerythrin-like domain-containing protein
VVHHAREDLVFARLIQRNPASAEDVLDLLTEHAQLAVLTHRFTSTLGQVQAGVELPRNWFDQVLSDYVIAMRSHMEIEEKEFFPRAADELTDVDWAEIDAMMEQIKGPSLADTIEEALVWLGVDEPRPETLSHAFG